MGRPSTRSTVSRIGVLALLCFVLAAVAAAIGVLLGHWHSRRKGRKGRSAHLADSPGQN